MNFFAHKPWSFLKQSVLEQRLISLCQHTTVYSRMLADSCWFSQAAKPLLLMDIRRINDNKHL